jgi:hypothetical protein
MFSRKVSFSARKEEWLPEDKSNFENFCTSALCKSVEKSLRNRISERSERVIQYVKSGEVQQAMVFASQMEEIEDILREFQNIRQDVSKKHA